MIPKENKIATPLPEITYKIKVVENFPDIKVKFVENFPGCEK